MRHYGFGRRGRVRKTYKTAVIHVPSTMDGQITGDQSTLFIIVSPSIFAAGSASSNIEAQDKDRTVNVGHHIGRLNLDISIRDAAADGVLEFCVFKVLRAAATPAKATHPVPSNAEVNTQGMQQACRLANPGLVFHYSKAAYTKEFTRIKKIIVSPAKYKQSQIKAGDHWCLYVFNRGTGIINIDFEARYKEFG